MEEDITMLKDKLRRKQKELDDYVLDKNNDYMSEEAEQIRKDVYKLADEINLKEKNTTKEDDVNILEKFSSNAGMCGETIYTLKHRIGKVLKRLKKLEENRANKDFWWESVDKYRNASNINIRTQITEKIEWLTVNILDNEHASNNDKDIAEHQVNVLQEIIS